MTRLRRGFSPSILLVPCLLWLAVSLAQAQSAPFGGIGAQVVPTVTGELVVLGVLPESPAALGGLRPGDMIIAVDDFALRGSDFHKVVMGKLWGEVGSEIRLRYLRPGKLGGHQVKLKRVKLQPGNETLPGVQLLTPGTQGEREKAQ